MADGKWITGLTPDMPAADAARKVLAGRLAVVAHYLPLAAERPDEDTEYVHQLRVATRRSGAALRLFKPVLPRKRLKDAKELLRTVRRAAGGARDWDVFVEGLDESEAVKGETAAPAVDFLVGYAFGHRAAAQEALTAVSAEYRDEVERLARTLPETAVAPLDGSAPATVGSLAAGVLADLFAEFVAEIDARPDTADDLHQLRITAKAVRYAMEVFAGLYPPPFREALYPAVERVQSVLGRVQDGHVGLRRVTAVAARVWAVRRESAARVMPGLDSLAEELRGEISGGRKAFKEWVKDWTALLAEHPLDELLVAGGSHPAPPSGPGPTAV